MNGFRRQVHRFGQHPQSAVGEPELFVLRVGEAGRRYHPVVQAEHHLDQAGDTGGALGVAEVALDRADRAGCVAARTVRVRKGFRLDHVAEEGAGAVRLDEADLLGHDPGGPVRRGGDLLLRPAVRRGDAVAAAVAVDRAALDHGVDRQARGDRVLQPAQHDDGDALASADSVGLAAERFAAPVRRRQACLRIEDVQGGGECEVDAGGERLVALRRAQRLRGQMYGDQRRRAGGVDREARALEVELVGEPVRGHEVAVARTGLRGDLAVVAQVQVGPFVGHHADEYAGVGTGLPARVEGGVFQRPPRRLQEQALLRIHRLGLARGDAEEVVVEGIGIADQPAGAVVDGAVVVQFGRVPALGRDLVDAVAAVEQQLPQRGGIVCLREAAVQPDDRDVGHVSCSSWTTSVSSPFRNAARIDARCTFPLVVR